MSQWYTDWVITHVCTCSQCKWYTDWVITHVCTYSQWPDYMSRKNRKFETDKFNTWNKGMFDSCNSFKRLFTSPLTEAWATWIKTTDTVCVKYHSFFLFNFRILLLMYPDSEVTVKCQPQYHAVWPRVCPSIRRPPSGRGCDSQSANAHCPVAAVGPSLRPGYRGGWRGQAVGRMSEGWCWRAEA